MKLKTSKITSAVKCLKYIEISRHLIDRRKKKTKQSMLFFNILAIFNSKMGLLKPCFNVIMICLIFYASWVTSMSGVKINPYAFWLNSWLLHFFFLIRHLKRLSVHNHFKYVMTEN